MKKGIAFYCRTTHLRVGHLLHLCPRPPNERHAFYNTTGDDLALSSPDLGEQGSSFCQPCLCFHSLHFPDPEGWEGVGSGMQTTCFSSSVPQVHSAYRQVQYPGR